LFEIAQTETLSVTRVDTYIAHVIHDVDVEVGDLLWVLQNNQMLLEVFDSDVVFAAFGEDHIGQIPSSLHTGGDHESDGVVHALGDELDETHHTDVPAFAWLVAVKVHDNEIRLLNVEELSTQFLRHRIELLLVETVFQNVGLFVEPLVFDHVLPVFGEHDASVADGVDVLDERVLLVLIHNVNVGDQLELAIGYLLNVFDEGVDNDQIVVYDDNMRIDFDDIVVDEFFSETLMFRFFVFVNIEHLDVIRQFALEFVLFVVVKVLEPEDVQLDILATGYVFC
jgi:hypothetical protein